MDSVSFPINCQRFNSDITTVFIVYQCFENVSTYTFGQELFDVYKF